MAAVNAFTDPTSGAISDASKSLQRLLLGAGPAQPLRTAAEQAPSWVRSKNGQERLKDVLNSLHEETDTPGKSAYLAV